MKKNTTTAYGSITKAFHWVIGIAIMGLLYVGFTMAGMEPSPEKWELYAAHKASGVVILTLVVLRLFWRLTNFRVLPAEGLAHWQMLLSGVTHDLLYLFMFVMPISGLGMSLLGGHDVSIFGLFTISAVEEKKAIAGVFHAVHEVSGFLLAGLVVLHILGSLYHLLTGRADIVRRMFR